MWRVGFARTVFVFMFAAGGDVAEVKEHEGGEQSLCYSALLR